MAYGFRDAQTGRRSDDALEMTISPEANTVRTRLRASLRERRDGGSSEFAFEAMGTHCRVSLVGSVTQAQALIARVLDWVAAFESKYSRFLPHSLISQINDAAGREPVPIDPETEQLFALCDQMHFTTSGVFDPTALPLLRLWNWKAGVVPTADAVDQAKTLVGWRKIQRSPGRAFLPRAGMGVDLGGMGKEYAVDHVARMLAGAGVTGALVDFGADVRVVGLPADGRPGWHIGLQDPKEPGRCWCGLGLRAGAVATSGDYVRHFQSNGTRYGHILDLRTGWPVNNGCQAASVLAPTCTLAGMLSTALFVLGPEAGMRLLESQLGAAGAVLTQERTVTSRHFNEHVVS